MRLLLSGSVWSTLPTASARAAKPDAPARAPLAVCGSERPEDVPTGRDRTQLLNWDPETNLRSSVEPAVRTDVLPDRHGPALKVSGTNGHLGEVRARSTAGSRRLSHPLRTMRPVVTLQRIVDSVSEGLTVPGSALSDAEFVTVPVERRNDRGWPAYFLGARIIGAEFTGDHIGVWAVAGDDAVGPSFAIDSVAREWSSWGEDAQPGSRAMEVVERACGLRRGRREIGCDGARPIERTIPRFGRLSRLCRRDTAASSEERGDKNERLRTRRVSNPPTL